jgi:acetyltransferase-like isoleucine patch superfamily enzyme
MKEGARIGHLNLIRNLDALVMGERASIGSGNWVSAYPTNTPPHFASQPGRSATLTMGPHSAITSRHRLDCTDAISIGAFSTVAGWDSQILTHSIDLAAGRQQASGVEIGQRCFVGTKCTVLPGSRLPDFCVLGAMSLLNAAKSEAYRLYGGTPARELKALDASMAYFVRKTGYVE